MIVSALLDQTNYRESVDQLLACCKCSTVMSTIALGSIAATIPVSTGVTLADGLAVAGDVPGLQALMRRGLQNWPARRRRVKNPPALVLWEGHVADEPMRRVKVTESRGARRRA